MAKDVYLESFDDLVKLQAHMDELYSAWIDSHKKAFKIYIEAGLPFQFYRNKHNEIEFDIGTGLRGE